MDFSSLNKMQLTEQYFKKHYKDFYNEIKMLPPTKFQEKIYWYINGLNDYPKCPMCGNIPSFLNVQKGYRTYCCRKCLNSDPNKKEKTKQTNIIKYGGVAPACSEKVREKAKKTCREKFGEDYAMQSPDIQRKAIETNRAKYNVDWVGSIKEIKEKAKQTQIERYGGVGYQSQLLRQKVNSTCQKKYGDPLYNNWEKAKQTQIERYGGYGNTSLEIKEKMLKTRHDNIIKNYDFLIGYTENDEWICKCPHENCNKCDQKTYITTSRIQYDRKRSNTELCTNLLPIQQSHSAGTTIELFVQNILDEIGVQYETNKFILNGQQIDIWIPSKNIGIELNGTFHHSTYFKEPNYHSDKFKLAKDLNIRLMTFWSDQIYNHPEIVKSMIVTKLGYCKDTIYARKCQIKEVASKEASLFLEKNHIQGSTPSAYKIGLYYKDKLVSLMTFSNNTQLQGSKKDFTWKLTRFCSLCNTRVIGAAGKLLKYFIEKHKPSTITSFSSNDISDGGLYKTLGFVSDHKINSSYFYIKGNKRWHRSSFTKARIVELGWRDKVDNTWTERDVMNENKFLCIYDSGTTKWTLYIK